MQFETEEALLAAMADALPDLVEIYVRPKGESLLKGNINKRIYAAYTPTRYVRSGELVSAIESETKKNGKYSVDYSVTSAADAAPPAIGWVYRTGGMLAMLEKGNMGYWRKGFPRPSISPTQRQFNNGYLDKAIMKGIESVF